MQTLEKHVNKVKPGPAEGTGTLTSRIVRILGIAGAPVGRADGTLCVQCMLVSVAGIKEAENGKIQIAELKEE